MEEQLKNEKRRWKSIVLALQKSVECPVCLETVKPPFKLCVGGHSVCLECMEKMEKCPLCQGLFVLENPVCVKNMLEALPHLCRYSDAGCEEMVEPGNDHEMFCGYRPIVCRSQICSVKMSLNECLDHCKTHWRVMTKDDTITWKVSLEKAAASYVPIHSFKNLFWVYMVNDVTTKQFHIFFQATPIGKLEHDYYARVELKEKDFVFTYTFKAQVLSSCEMKLQGQQYKQLEEEYCMKVPQKELHHFISPEGELKIKVFVFEK